MTAPEQTKDRETALAEFTARLEAYERSYDSVPDEALTYVTDTLLHYRNVLDVMKGAGDQTVRNVDPEDDAKRQRDELVHNGFAGSEKPRVFEAMRAAHRDVEQRVRALPEAEYGRKIAVLYGADAQEAYPTNGGDVLGWLTDHYQEHIDQVAELMGKWQAERR